MYIKKGIKAILPYGVIVLLQKYKYKKTVIDKRLEKAKLEEHLIKTGIVHSENIFDTIYKLNTWGNSEAKSGPGSSVRYTKPLRKALPKMWKKYNVNTFLDAPCGDFNWIQLVNMDSINYIGCDIVDSVIDNNIKLYSRNNIQFHNLDITKDDLPKVDMILCKDCLQHLSNENVYKSLNNFKRSGSKYLLVTSYPLTHQNWDIKDGDYRPLNLFIEPFNLKFPLEEIKEGSSGGDIDRTEYLIEL